MCGRTACTLAPASIKENVGITEWLDEMKYKGPSFNVAPRDYQAVIMRDLKGNKFLRSMRWGVVPSHWKDSVMKELHTINARSERLKQSLWKKLAEKRRCVVIAEGFYEWKQQGTIKQPYYVTSTHNNSNHKVEEKGEKKKGLLLFGGLWDCWVHPETGEELYTYAIVTTPACKNYQELHDRMPLLLNSEEKLNMWLNCEENSIDSLAPLLNSNTGELEWYAVPTLVNSWKNDSATCIRKLEEHKAKTGITSFFQPMLKKQKIEGKVEPKQEEDQLTTSVVQ